MLGGARSEGEFGIKKIGGRFYLQGLHFVVINDPLAALGEAAPLVASGGIKVSRSVVNLIKAGCALSAQGLVMSLDCLG